MKVLLQEIRKSRGLSQNDLARLTRMSPQNIQRIEQGEAKSLTFKTLALFCRVLHCQPGDILVYEDDPNDASTTLNQEPQSLAPDSPSNRGKQFPSGKPPRLEHLYPVPQIVGEFPNSA